MNTVLVTGATGNVGSHVVRELQALGASFRAFVRDRTKAAGMLPGDIDLAVGDFGDIESIRAALAGADRVLLSCANGPRQVEYETNVIDAASAAGVRQLVKLSTIGAQVGSSVDFWDWHGQSDQHLREAGLPAVILQSGFYMSNLFMAAESVTHTGKLFAPADAAKIAMIDPRDVAAVAAVTLMSDGHDGRTYTLTGPEAVTYDDVAEQLSAATGRTIEFVDLPDEAARAGVLEAGAPEWLADNLVRVFGMLRQGVVAQATDHVRMVTGRAPRTFAQFARDYAAIFGG